MSKFCPFITPVEKEISTQDASGKTYYRIIEANKHSIAAGLTEKNADYIVQAINSHEILYREGYEDGLRAFAWWKDGIQYVGSCGTTLKQALQISKGIQS